MLKHAIPNHTVIHSVEKATNNPTTPFQTTSFTRLTINYFHFRNAMRRHSSQQWRKAVRTEGVCY